MSQVEQLELERQRLIASAEPHRARIIEQVHAITATLGWLDRASGLLRSARPILLVAAPIAGFLLARRGSRVLRFLVSFVPLWRIVQRMSGRVRG